MKKISILLLITVAYSSFGQNKKSTSIGIFGGISQTDLVGKGYINEFYEKTPGFELGGVISKDISNKLSVTSGITLSKVGVKDEIEFTDDQGNHLGKYKDKYNLKYIQVPLSLNFNLTKKKWLMISGGTYVAQLIEQKREQEYTHNSQTTEMESNFKKFDIGVKSSIGSCLQITKNVSITSDLYFKKGFNNLLKNSNSDDEISNLSFGLNLGLAYSLN